MFGDWDLDELQEQSYWLGTGLFIVLVLFGLAGRFLLKHTRVVFEPCNEMAARVILFCTLRLSRH
jgi:hypothetical protein